MFNCVPLIQTPKMTTLNELEWHVMDALADDWESIVQIRPHVVRWLGPTSDERIAQCLRSLHQHDLVCIMDSEGFATSRFSTDPTECWFAMTESGRTLWDSEGVNFRDESE